MNKNKKENFCCNSNIFRFIYCYPIRLVVAYIISSCDSIAYKRIANYSGSNNDGGIPFQIKDKMIDDLKKKIKMQNDQELVFRNTIEALKAQTKSKDNEIKQLNASLDEKNVTIGKQEYKLANYESFNKEYKVIVKLFKEINKIQFTVTYSNNSKIDTYYVYNSCDMKDSLFGLLYSEDKSYKEILSSCVDNLYGSCLQRITETVKDDGNVRVQIALFGEQDKTISDIQKSTTVQNEIADSGSIKLKLKQYCTDFINVICKED